MARALPPLPQLTPHTRLTGAQRIEVGKLVARHYREAGVSVRAIAKATGRSYGWAHRTLHEQEGLVVRARGGARRKR